MNDDQIECGSLEIVGKFEDATGDFSNGLLHHGHGLPASDLLPGNRVKHAMSK